MIVLGIHPGLSNTGYGLIHVGPRILTAHDGGVIYTSSDDALTQRLVEIFTQVNLLLDRYEPDAISIEEIFFGSNVQSAFSVGQAKGVICLAGGQRGIPCFSYNPQQVKAAVSGSGRADKEQVQRMVKTLLRLDALPKPDHAADALAVAICHANSVPLRDAIGSAT